jgi:hypothetical protein
LANDKVFIFNDENIKINVYEENRTDVHLINDSPSIEIIKIYEPGPQGPKGNDGGEFVLPDNVVSSSNQIASDISGSFTVVSESLSQRINFFENKTLISGSDQLSSIFELRGNNIVSASNQLTSSYDSRYELRGTGILSSSNGFISSSQQVKDNLPTGTVSSSNQLSSVFESKGSNLLSSSQQISTEISGAFGQVSSSFQSRISTIESKTLVSGSQQIKNLLPTGVVSGSEQVTSSLDLRYHRLGTGLFSSSQQVTYGQISNVPSGILSSSNGFISASSQVDFAGVINKPTLLSGSSQVVYGQLQNIPAGIVSGSDQISSSYDLKYETRGRGIISSSNGFISSSAQVDYTFIQNKPTTILSASYALTASYVSGSNNSSISSSYSVSSSYAVSASYAPSTAFPTGLLSSSQQINLLIPNLVSGSDQLSGSFDSRYERKGSNIVSSSLQLASDISGSSNIRFDLLENKTGSYATTGSNQFNGHQNIIGNVTASIVSSSYIDFDNLVTANIPAWKPGRIFYDSDLGAFTAYNAEPDISLQIGQEIYLRVFNNSGTPITDGTAVRISGSQGDMPYIWKADTQPLERNINRIIGVATHTIENNSIGYVTERGIVKGINTTAFVAGDTLFVSASGGQLTNVEPIFPNEKIKVGFVVRSHVNGMIFVSPNEPIHIHNLVEFSSSAFQTNDLWVYDGAIQGWKSTNKNLNLSGSFSGSFGGSGQGLAGVVSSSYALTASYALNGGGTNIQTIGIRISTQDSFITEGSKGFRHIGYNSSIIKLRSIANIAGTINLNVKRDGILLGNYNLTNASSSIDTTLTGWTTSLNANDLIEFSVSQSSTYITDLTFFMDLQSI